MTEPTRIDANGISDVVCRTMGRFYDALADRCRDDPERHRENEAIARLWWRASKAKNND